MVGPGTMETNIGHPLNMPLLAYFKCWHKLLRFKIFILQPVASCPSAISTPDWLTAPNVMATAATHCGHQANYYTFPNLLSFLSLKRRYYTLVDTSTTLVFILRWKWTVIKREKCLTQFVTHVSQSQSIRLLPSFLAILQDLARHAVKAQEWDK